MQGCEAPVGAHVYARERLAELRLFAARAGGRCVDRAYIRRKDHEYDRDGRCLFCGRRSAREEA